jgi:hypothetical protein
LLLAVLPYGLYNNEDQNMVLKALYEVKTGITRSETTEIG